MNTYKNLVMILNAEQEKTFFEVIVEAESIEASIQKVKLLNSNPNCFIEHTELVEGYEAEGVDPETLESWEYLRGDKFGVEFKDGSTQTYKHVYGGIQDLLSMLDLSKVSDIYDI